MHTVMKPFLAAALLAGSIAIPAAFAQTQPTTPQSSQGSQAQTDHRGMMQGQGGMMQGQGGMMGGMMGMDPAQMSRMMDNCNKMMEGMMQNQPQQGSAPQQKG